MISNNQLTLSCHIKIVFQTTTRSETNLIRAEKMITVVPGHLIKLLQQFCLKKMSYHAEQGLQCMASLRFWES